MPTPIGHALGGLVVGLAFERWGPQTGTVPTKTGTVPRGSRPSRAVSVRELSVCVAAACLPDVDFFWGRHNMETHSLGFAAVVGLWVWAYSRFRRGAHADALGWRPGQLALAATLAVVSHVLFDWLGSDDFPPLGVMALWPLSHAFYFADAFVFAAISRRYWLPGFVAHNLWAVAREVAILGPVVAALWWARRNGRRRD